MTNTGWNGFFINSSSGAVPVEAIKRGDGIHVLRFQLPDGSSIDVVGKDNILRTVNEIGRILSALS